MNSKLCTQYLSKQQRYFKDFEILNSEEDEVKLSQYELFEYKTYIMIFVEISNMLSLFAENKFKMN